MRFFNTAGPVRPDDHYAIPPRDRVDIDELLGLIRAKQYFVLHAPRQTGKTSALIALRDLLNSGEAGDFRSLFDPTTTVTSYKADDRGSASKGRSRSTQRGEAPQKCSEMSRCTDWHRATRRACSCVSRSWTRRPMLCRIASSYSESPGSSSPAARVRHATSSA